MHGNAMSGRREEIEQQQRQQQRLVWEQQQSSSSCSRRRQRVRSMPRLPILLVPRRFRRPHHPSHTDSQTDILSLPLAFGHLPFVLNQVLWSHSRIPGAWFSATMRCAHLSAPPAPTSAGRPHQVSAKEQKFTTSTIRSLTAYDSAVWFFLLPPHRLGRDGIVSQCVCRVCDSRAIQYHWVHGSFFSLSLFLCVRVSPARSLTCSFIGLLVFHKIVSSQISLSPPAISLWPRGERRSHCANQTV